MKGVRSFAEAFGEYLQVNSNSREMFDFEASKISQAVNCLGYFDRFSGA